MSQSPTRNGLMRSILLYWVVVVTLPALFARVCVRTLTRVVINLYTGSQKHFKAPQKFRPIAVGFVIFVLIATFLFTALKPEPETAHAATSSTINFQARLLNSAGNVVPDGNYHIEFKIYDSLAAGSSAQGVCSLDSSSDDCWWRETRTTGNLVRVVNGYFTVNLGSVTAFSSTIPWDQELWLSMNIGGTSGPSWDGEMSPRMKLTAVPYALTAGKLQANSSGITNQLVFATPSASNKTITLPNETGTVCTTGSICSGYQAAGTYFVQGGNTLGATATLGTNDANSLQFETQNVVQATIAVGGATTFQNSTDSVAAFVVQDASGDSILSVDTANDEVEIGKPSDTTGKLVFYNSGTANTATIQSAAQGTSTVLTIPNVGGASDTFCLLTLANCAGTGDIIQNGNSFATTVTIGSNDSNNLAFETAGTTRWIIDTNGHFVPNVNDTYDIGSDAARVRDIYAGPGTVHIGTSTADEGTLSYNTTTNNLVLGATNGVLVQNPAGSTTAFQVQNASGANLINVDTSTTVNLVTNGDIEGAGTTGWAAKGATTLSQSSSHQWQGNNSLSVATTTAADDGARYNYNFGATTQYTLSLWAKVGSGSITDFVVGRQDQSGTDINCLTGQTVTTNWTRFSCTFTTGGTISSSNIYVQKSGGSAETIFIDGIQLQTGASVTAFDAGGKVQLGIINSPFTVQNKQNSTTAFQIQNSAGTSNLFVADTTNTKIGIGLTPNSSGALLQVGGSISTTGNLSFDGGDNATIQDYGDNLTFTVDVDNNGSGNLYSFYGNGDSDAILQFNNTGAATFRNNSDSTTGFVVQDASGDSLLTVDTTNDEIEIGVASDTTARLVLYNASGSGNILLTPANPGASTYTITLPAETGTVCTTGSVCTGYAAAPVSGSYLQQVPPSTAANTVTPTANSVVGLTINGTSGTAATAVDIIQAGAATGLAVTSSSTGNGQSINLTNTSGTQTNGLLIDRNGGGGTTTNLLNLQNTAGTATNGINFGGTYTNLINSSVFTVTNGGTVSAASGFDRTGAGTLGIGNAVATTLNIGSNGATNPAINIDSGTGTISIGTGAQARTTNIATGAAAQALTLGSTNTTSSTTVQSGTGDLLLTSTDAVLIDSAGLLELNSSGGAINIGNDAVAQAINIGTGAAARTITVGNTTGATGLVLQAGSGGITLGSGAGQGQLTNNGSTVNTTLALTNDADGGVLGSTAAATVDIYTSISLAQTSASQTFTLATPTASTVYGRVVYVSNIGTASFSLYGSNLDPGGTAALVWSNTNGGASWQYSGTGGGSGSYIQNQNSADQTANFRISGTGRANTSFTSPLFDSISGGLGLGTSTATGVTIGGTTNTTAVLLQGAAAATYTIGTSNNTGGITLGNSTATNTISIGAVAGGSATQTINIGNSSTASSTTNINIGSAIGTSTTLIEGGANGSNGTIILRTAANGVINIGNNSVAGKTVNIGTTGSDTTTSTINIANTSGAAAQTVSIGSTSTTSSLALQSGTGDLTINSTDAVLVDSAGLLELNSSGGAISIGNDAVAQAINIGTGAAARTITIGNVSGATSLVLNAGTGNIDIGTTAQARATNIATGAAAQTVTIGSTNSTSSLLLQGGTGAVTLENQGTGNINIANNAVNSVINIGKTGSTANTTTLNLATSTGAAQTIYIGGTGGAGANSNASTAVTVQGGTTSQTITASGSTVRTFTNTTTAFQVQNAAGTTLFNVDSTNSQINLVKSIFSGNILPGSGSSAYTTSTSSATIDSTSSSTGQGISAGVGNDGLPVIAYNFNDGANQQLRFMKCSTADCTTNSQVVADSTSGTGDSPSMTIDSNGLPWIAHYKSSGTHLRVTQCSNSSCSGTNTNTDVDSTGSVGQYPSITIGSDGYPIISYRDTTNTALKFADYVGSGGTGCASSAWTCTAITNTGDFGDTSKLLLGSDGVPIIAYSDVTNGDLEFARYVGSGGTGCATATWNCTTLDSTNNVADTLDMAIGANGFPIIAYRDATATDAVVYACSNVSCSAGTKSTVETAAGNNGQYITVAIGQDAKPIIAYSTSTGTLRATKCVTSTCSPNTGNVSTQLNSSADAGNFNSIVIPSDGLPFIAHYDVTATNLLGYRCANQSCSGTTTGYTAGIDIGSSSSVFNNGYIQNIRTSDPSRPFTISTNNIERLTISGADGATTIKSDSTSAFSVQDTSGNIGLRVDTTNTRIGIGVSASSYTVGLGEGADRTIGVETRTSNAAGRNLTISAGAAGSGGSAFQGGTLLLQGGAAGGTGNANGGAVSITGGAGTGTGVLGLVNIYPASFTSSGSTQSFGVNGSITGVDSYSSVAVNATASSLIVTLPVPNAGNQVVGRIIYVTAVDNSNDFTLRLGGTNIDIAMKENSTATLIWNGTGWTAAGASSSTDLQSAYNNTLTSAGGAELVLNPSGGAADGLTIRNNGTTPIIGGIFEAQTAIGSNLFSVNNNATEYANNGGAETTTFTMWTGTPTGGTIARTTTAANIATGQAATSVTTTATIGHGVENTLTTTLTNALKYQVSFAIKADSTYSAFSTLDVMYSYDGSALRHCVSGTPYYSIGTASQSGTTITGSGTAFTAAMVGKTFVYADGRSTVISGYTSGTQLTAATSQTVSSQNYGIYDAGYSVKSSVWSRVTCFFTAPPSGTTITASNSVMIRQTDATARVFYVDNLSVTVSADVNHAVDGSVDDATNFTSNWTTYGAGTTAARDTSVIYDTGASARVDTPNNADRGIRNNMTITPAASTQYLVSFYARSGTGAINDLTVRYSEDGGTSFVSCVDYNTQAITTSAWTKITCLFTSDGSVPGSPNPDLIFTQNTAPGGTRSIYIDALSITLNNNNSSNIQIGGANKGGPITLFTLDRSSNAPIAGNNDAYLGSMYYDTTTGRIQCYEADGWGACGSAPDNYVNLNPEYAGAVLNGTGVGTMTADFCANQSGVLQINYVASTDPCFTAGDVRNYYKWTSPQATQQTYSIYVTYQLPATFKGFSSDDTVQLVARADSTSNAAVTYQMFRSENGSLTQCGSGETTVVTSANTWQSVGINGNEATSCNFSTSSANAFLIFKINLKANSNANAYVSTLSFITTGR